MDVIKSLFKAMVSGFNRGRAVYKQDERDMMVAMKRLFTK